MATPPNSHQERPSTYFVQDRSSEDELLRLKAQDELVTASMGGVLPEQSNPGRLRRILDIGCGTGDWLIEAAKTYPDIEVLIGVDISRRMVEYARAQAEAQQVNDRVEFHVMDVLLMLEFPDRYFDLVNQRAGMSYLRTWDWPKLLQEFQRVTRPRGIIRVTEGDALVKSNSPALTRLGDLWLQTFYQAGHFFRPGRGGLTGELARLLSQHGLQDVQTHAHVLEYRASTPEGQRLIEDLSLLFRTVLPFLQRWIKVPKDYEDLYQQMLHEMHQQDFVATLELLTAWGTRPPIRELANTLMRDR